MMLDRKRVFPLVLLFGAFFLVFSRFSSGAEFKIYVPFALRETGPVSGVAYRDTFRSEIILTNVGTAATSMQAAFYDFQGKIVKNVSRNLNAKATITLSLTTEFGSTAFAGSVIVTANQPLAGVVLQRPRKHYNRPAPLSRAFSSPGDSRVYLSTVLRNKFDSTTRFAVQNTSNAVANLILTVYDAEDQQVKLTRIKSVNPGASWHVDMGKLDIPNFSGSGSAVIESITSTGTVVASAMELDTTNQRAKGFEGASQGSKTVYMATALCQAYDQRTTTYYAVQNTSLTETAVVRAEYSNGAAEEVTIGPGAKRSINPCTALRIVFSGAAQMSVVSGDAEILALGKAADSYSNPTAFHGVASGGRRVALPYVQWRTSPTGLRTYVAVQNLSDISHTATIRFYNASGSQNGASSSLHVQPLQKVNFTFASLVSNSDFNGSVLIEGSEGANFNVIARTAWDDDTPLIPREDYNGVVLLSPYELLAPVSAGQQLVVIHGYNDPLLGESCVIGRGPDHCLNQKYGLDLEPSDQDDLDILAPLPGTVGWISGDCLGLRTQDNYNLNICHFEDFDVEEGQQVNRGTILGTRSTSWIHLSLDDRYRNSSKPAVPFNGVHTLEGVSFEPGGDSERNQHYGRSFTSTNGPGM